MESPYELKCSYYDSSETPFNSISHKHCIRQRMRYYCEIVLNCSCFGLISEDYITINEMDYGFKNIEMCDISDYRNLSNSYLSFSSHFLNNQSMICTKLCPINCIHNIYQ